MHVEESKQRLPYTFYIPFSKSGCVTHWGLTRELESYRTASLSPPLLTMYVIVDIGWEEEQEGEEGTGDKGTSAAPKETSATEEGGPTSLLQ